MKLRKYLLLLLAIILFFTSTVSVNASPHQQDAQEALIRQVLTATAQELGWKTSISYTVATGIPEWEISKCRIGIETYAENAYITLLAYNSTKDAKNAHPGLWSKGFDPEWSIFHGYTIGYWAEAGMTSTSLQAERFIIFITSMPRGGGQQTISLKFSIVTQ